MKIGRLILTHREDLILSIRDFYLKNRSEFLVIAYNQNSVRPEKFIETENFKLLPYFGKGLNGSIAGKQYYIWAQGAKAFPQIDAWVMHDYDVLCKPTDAEIFAHIPVGHYAGLGMPFYMWQEGISQPTTKDIYPFWYHYVSENVQPEITYFHIKDFLLKRFPLEVEKKETFMCGYGDWVAAYRSQLLLLDDPVLKELETIGSDSVPPTVFAYNGILPVDLRKYFSMYISFDNTLYVPFENKFDISHPVKFWPKGTLKATFNEFSYISCKCYPVSEHKSTKE